MIVEKNIRIASSPMAAEESLQAIGDLLEQVGSTKAQYTTNMIKSYRELGPYFVIAPGIALAHAKPDESVLVNDMALIVCQHPVVFNSHNDPVTLLFGLCATSGDSHMENIVAMADLLSEEETIERIKNATSAQEVALVLQDEATRKE